MNVPEPVPGASPPWRPRHGAPPIADRMLGSKRASQVLQVVAELVDDPWRASGGAPADDRVLGRVRWANTWLGGGGTSGPAGRGRWSGRINCAAAPRPPVTPLSRWRARSPNPRRRLRATQSRHAAGHRAGHGGHQACADGLADCAGGSSGGRSSGWPRRPEARCRRPSVERCPLICLVRTSPGATPSPRTRREGCPALMSGAQPGLPPAKRPISRPFRLRGRAETVALMSRRDRCTPVGTKPNERGVRSRPAPVRRPLGPGR